MEDLHVELSLPPSLQDYIVLCLDTGPSMDTAPLDEAETRLETAVSIAFRIVQQKVSLCPSLSSSVGCSSRL